MLGKMQKMSKRSFEDFLFKRYNLNWYLKEFQVKMHSRLGYTHMNTRYTRLHGCITISKCSATFDATNVFEHNGTKSHTIWMSTRLYWSQFTGTDLNMVELRSPRWTSTTNDEYSDLQLSLCEDATDTIVMIHVWLWLNCMLMVSIFSMTCLEGASL